VDTLINTIITILKSNNIASSIDDYGALKVAIQHESDFFETVLPFMQNLVLQTPSLFDNGKTGKNNVLLLLKSDSSGTVSLSRERCACIIGKQ
jgi:hypothetical protein